MISLLVTLLVFAIVIYVVNLILGMIVLPPQVKTIIFIILGLIFLFYLLNMLGLGIPLDNRPVLR